jgi:hypothetical protein
MDYTPSVPEDAEELSLPGYFMHITKEVYPGNRQAVMVALLVRSENTGAIQHLRIGRLIEPYISAYSGDSDLMYRFESHLPLNTRIGIKTARMIAEIMNHVAKVMEDGEAKIGPDVERMRAEREKREAEREEERKVYRERMERERQERAIRLQAEREARDKRRAEVLEIVKYMLDEKVRLTRHGHRSTVFGTIDRVNDHYGTMNITTERGVPMQINLGDVKTLDVKYPDDKRYTKLYEEGATHA